MAIERDCGADVWHLTVGEQRTESGNEKQEDVEPPPNRSSSVKLDLRGLKRSKILSSKLDFN